MAKTHDQRDLTLDLGSLSPAPRRSRRRWPLAAVALIVVSAWAAMAVRNALAARADIEEGREALERARAVLLEGDLEEADRAFRAAGSSFAEAAAGARSGAVTVARALPIAGRTPDALLAVAETGEDVARAGLRITEAIARLPGGLSALGPRGGRVRVEPFEELAPALREAAELARSARARVEAISTLMVPGMVTDARREALWELRRFERTLEAGAGLLEELPVLLGADRPARFFVGAQNPAELRGTGGLIGAYSIMEVRGGRFRFGEFGAIQDLPTFRPHAVEPPNPDYARHYDQFGGAGFWLNINMTPDVPSAAAAIRETYARATGIELDGVMLADPLALRALLEFTGPLEVPRIGEVEAETVVDFLSNSAYRRFADDHALRKAVLGETALAVLERFLGHAGDEGTGAAWLRTLGEAVGQGHIQVWSADPEVEAALERAGVAGSIRPPRGSDFLSVVQNNGAGNKVDYYLDREVTYTVRLGRAGTAEARVAIRLVNRSPDRGLPRYVIGPYPGASAAGEHVSYTAVYCQARCALRRATRGDAPVEVYSGTELGASFYRDHLRVPSGEETTVRMDLALAAAWVPEGGGGIYRLTYLDQPTIRPTRFRLIVIPPEGMKITDATPGMRVTDGRAVWEGDPRRMEAFEVAFG